LSKESDKEIHKNLVVARIEQGK